MNLRFSGEESSIAFGMDSILPVNVGHVFNNSDKTFSRYEGSLPTAPSFQMPRLMQKL